MIDSMPPIPNVFWKINQKKGGSVSPRSHQCVCVCVYASRINPQTDRKRDRDWQPVISAILSLPSPLHWYADRAFQLLSVFSSRDVCVCLRLEARVCTKVHRPKALIDCLRGVRRRLRPAGLIAGPSFGGRTHIPSGSEYQMRLSQM